MRRRVSFTPPGRLLGNGRKNNAFRRLAAATRVGRRCKCGATPLSPPRTILLGAHQGLEARIGLQIAPPPADVLAALKMAGVRGWVAFQQGNRLVAVAEQGPLHRLY